MFSTDKSVETLRQLFLDLREFLELRGRSVQLTLVEKFTVAASAFVLGALLFIVSAFVLMFISVSVVTLLASSVGGVALASAIVAFVYVLFGVLIWFNRRRWIVNPIATFMANLVLDVRQRDNESEVSPV